MSNNSFTRFQKRNGTYRQAAQSKLNTHFIFQGYPSIKIEEARKLKEDDEDDQLAAYQAVVVNQDDKDGGYIYTQLANELPIGSVWTAKTLHMLVDHEVVIIKDVNWHKYHFITCNVECDDWWGYFVGPEKNHIDLELHQNTILTSKQKPVLVAAGQPLGFEDKIMIGGRAWMVDEFDAISTPGITYYSLLATTMSKTADEKDDDIIYVEPKEEKTLQLNPGSDAASEYVNKGQLVELTTEEGFFKTSLVRPVMKKHNANSVTFEVPFGISSFDVQIKQKGMIVIQHYCVIG